MKAVEQVLELMRHAADLRLPIHSIEVSQEFWTVLLHEVPGGLRGWRAHQGAPLTVTGPTGSLEVRRAAI